jgi:Ca2+-binding RTX toxin-like protein
VAGVIAILFFGLAMLSWSDELGTITRQQWREASVFVASQFGDSDVIHIMPGYERKHFEYYFEPESRYLNVRSDQDSWCENGQRVWLVGTPAMRQLDDVGTKLMGECSLVTSERFVGALSVALLSDRDFAGAQALDCDGRTPTIIGTPGDDLLNGTAGDDVIVALEGNDHINGNDGNDIVCAGDGDDIVNAGGGNDRVFGSGGADVLNGSTGDDELFGGEGDDKLNASEGADELHGEAGNDTLNTGPGSDIAFGGEGNDVLNGADGDDALDGGTGDDILKGGAGDDAVDGGEGRDDLDGGGGEDSCVAGEELIRCESGQQVVHSQ